MPGPNRGALPLVLLIVAALAAGIVVMVTRLREAGEPQRAEPVPTITIPTSEPALVPTTPSTPETITTPESLPPTTPPTLQPTLQPTTEETSESPEPTEPPSPRSPKPPGTLANTGGPVLPWLAGGAIMIAAGGGLWRVSRRRRP